MNLPKETRSYCPKCKSHQKMKVSIYKAGKRRGSAAGERRHALRKKGYGGRTASVHVWDERRSTKLARNAVRAFADSRVQERDHEPVHLPP